MPNFEQEYNELRTDFNALFHALYVTQDMRFALAMLRAASHRIGYLYAIHRSEKELEKLIERQTELAQYETDIAKHLPAAF